jgi:hypothetical protein
MSRRSGRFRAGPAAAHLVLGIETSCDDTSVAVLEDGQHLRSHLIAAQDVHRLYGGVVPELASRAHLDLLPRMVEQALADASLTACGPHRDRRDAARPDWWDRWWSVSRSRRRWVWGSISRWWA